jgi:transposase
MTWLESRREKIISGELVVFFQDECHLLWGDICGYVWGKTNERVEVPVINQRERQSYYGALNIQSCECLVKAYEKGNSESTVNFLQYLTEACPKSQIAIIWDGAGYHRSQEIRDYLSQLNHGLSEVDWKITCIRFAPNDPSQNPIEDVWLQVKQSIREFYHLLKSFSNVKMLFELESHRQIFNFPKVSMYGSFYN